MSIRILTFSESVSLEEENIRKLVQSKRCTLFKDPSKMVQYTGMNARLEGSKLAFLRSGIEGP